jgi:hypothetical protein
LKAGHSAQVDTGESPMSDNKIMPWIDELEGAAATDFPARRDEIAAMMAEAAELVRKAEELRGKAYFAGCSWKARPRAIGRWKPSSRPSAGSAGKSTWPGRRRPGYRGRQEGVLREPRRDRGRPQVEERPGVIRGAWPGAGTP